jgi:hypothetical protein
VREVLARTQRPSRLLWVNAGAPTLLLAVWVPRVLGGERGVAVVLVVLAAVSLTAAVATMLVDARAALVLTDDELVVERRLGLRPRRVARLAVRAVDGNVHGRPSWSDTVVITVRDGDRDRLFRLGGFDVHARVLVPRIQEWAGVGDTASRMTPDA